ncbi:MAG: hypothetical protein IE911_14900, partial [Brevundimonas sp.]|nr:hypothetical protein [Brevundimonas sp.]
PEEAAAHERSLPAHLRPLAEREPAAWREPVGCPKCGQSGFRGRVGVYEIAPMSPALIAGLRDSADEDRLTATARGDGFLSFVDDGYLKARRGETALTEIHRIAGGDAGLETA